MGGVVAHGGGVSGQCRLQPAGRLHQQAETVVRLGVLRSSFEQGLEMLLAGLDVADDGERRCELDRQLGVVRLQLQAATKQRDPSSRVAPLDSPRAATLECCRALQTGIDLQQQWVGTQQHVRPADHHPPLRRHAKQPVRLCEVTLAETVVRGCQHVMNEDRPGVDRQGAFKKLHRPQVVLSSQRGTSQSEQRGHRLRVETERVLEYQSGFRRLVVIEIRLP